jgi:hypothetical protein
MEENEKNLRISLLEEIDKGLHLFLIHSWKTNWAKKLNPERLRWRAVPNHYTKIFFLKMVVQGRCLRYSLQLRYIYIFLGARCVKPDARFNLLFLFMVWQIVVAWWHVALINYVIECKDNSHTAIMSKLHFLHIFHVLHHQAHLLKHEIGVLHLTQIPPNSFVSRYKAFAFKAKRIWTVKFQYIFQKFHKLFWDFVLLLMELE